MAYVGPRRTALVTGASSGIGAAAARALHAAGLQVFVSGRDRDRTAMVAAELDTEPILVDYADLADVRRAAEQILQLCPQLHVLANNAGGNWSSFERTVDGYERTWQVNYLAPALLTELLLPRLRDGAGWQQPARIIATSSGIAKRARLSVDDGFATLNDPHRFSSVSAYGSSKLANIFYTRELHRRELKNHVIAVSFQPGMVATDLARDNAVMSAVQRTPIARLMRTPERGADPLVWLATTPVGELSPGGHYANRKLSPTGKKGADPVLGARLWRLTETVLAGAGETPVEP